MIEQAEASPASPKKLAVLNTSARQQKRQNVLAATLPIVIKSLASRKKPVIYLLFLSFILGVLPTVKATVEASFMNMLAHQFSSPVGAYKPQPKGDLQSLLWAPIDELDLGAGEDQADFALTLTAKALVGKSVLVAILFYTVLALATYLFAIASRKTNARLTSQVFAELRSEGLRKGLAVDAGAASGLTNAPSQYASAIQQGAHNVANAYSYLLQVGEYLFSLVTTLFVVFAKNWLFALSCVVLVSGQAALSLIQARRLRRHREKLDEQRNGLVARTDEILQKREIILAFDQELAYQEKLGKITRNYAEIDRELEVSEERYKQMSASFVDLGRLLIVLAALGMVWFGNKSLTDIGAAVFLVSVYTRILGPATQLLARYDDIRRSESTSRTFLSILGIPEHGTVVDDCALVSPEAPAEVEFRDVSFRYSNETKEAKNKTPKWILRNCSFTIPRGKTTLIVGRSGSGKTTIARLILGFLSPSGGEVLIDEISTNSLPSATLRRRLAYVSQGDHIIDDTVGENLAWSYRRGEKVTPEQMGKALVDVKVCQPDEAKKFLSQEARTLSIGQQQRLSFARLMLDESDLMVLDEPFAGVDVFTIQDIRPTLELVFRRPSQTRILFSHRLAFTALADHVIVLGEHANIEEEGSPKDLLRREGIFSRLHSAAIQELGWHSELELAP
jgi:subfamily B ATP-binding cassette protein MsbA